MKQFIRGPITRRSALKAIGGLGLAATGALSFPVFAENRPIRIGIIAPKGGIAGTIGICGLRGTQFAVDKMNADGGIAGRKIELIVEEETNAKNSIERLRKLVLQDKVDCVQGIVSSGVGLAMGPAAEELKTVTIYWDGTTQDGVDETMQNPRYLFRSTDNECEAVMASLLTVKHFKGQFATVAGINPDYSYGRNNWAAFLALLKRFGIKVEVVAEQWPRVGTLDFSSHVGALKAAKPDLIFTSLLFAGLPVFMQTANAAGLTEDTKFVAPAAGFQHTLLKKSFTPENMIFGHNTLYFDLPDASPIQKEFVAMYFDRFKDYPHWEADRAYFAMQVYKAGVEKAVTAKSGKWPTMEEVASSIEGVKVESLGGPGHMRTDHIAEQTFYQGLTTHNNDYDFCTLGVVDKMYSDQLQKPAGSNFWKWLETAKISL